MRFPQISRHIDCEIFASTDKSRKSYMHTLCHCTGLGDVINCCPKTTRTRYVHTVYATFCFVVVRYRAILPITVRITSYMSGSSYCKTGYNLICGSYLEFSSGSYLAFNSRFIHGIQLTLFMFYIGLILTNFILVAEGYVTSPGLSWHGQ